QTEGAELGTRRGGRGPADRVGDGEAGHRNRDGSAGVGARDDGGSEVILGVADLVGLARREDAREIDGDLVEEVPVVDGDVGAARVVLVRTNLGPASRGPASEVGVVRVLARVEARQVVIEGGGGDRQNRWGVY